MDLEKISAVHLMLHLIFHRNKNQHGTTKWWKWLSILKRTTLKLIRCLENDSLHSGIKSSAGMYTQYLATQVIPSCYLAFSTVVADGQFSTLGTVMLAALARLARATGIDKQLKTLSKAEKILDRPSPSTKFMKNEDVGELVSRPRDSVALVEASKSTTKKEPVKADDTPRELKNAAVAEAKKPVKKKKKKNAIDDLFSGFL